MEQNYVEKLESHFHVKFIQLPSNVKLKKYNIVAYVKMLERMCKQRNIFMQKEPYHVSNNYIYIKNQNGDEIAWQIYDDTEKTYKVHYYNLITEIYRDKTYLSEDNKLHYSQPIRVPQSLNRDSLTFIKENKEKLCFDEQQDIIKEKMNKLNI